MNNPDQNTTRFAICVNNVDYPVALELHKIYQIVPDSDADEEGDLRIVDESGEDYLYPNDYFLILELPDQTTASLKASFKQIV